MALTNSQGNWFIKWLKSPHICMGKTIETSYIPKHGIENTEHQCTICGRKWRNSEIKY